MNRLQLKRALLIALSVLSLIASLTQNASAQTKATDKKEASENFVLFCGSRAELQAYMKKQGLKATEKEFKEMSESRTPLLNILARGAQGIDELLTEGSKSDTGAFGALIACGMINEIKSEILEKGCTHLETNKVVKNQGGIEACAQLLKNIPQE